MECENSDRMHDLPMTISLRPYRADDQEFLFRLYASTRIHEIAGFGWPVAQQEMFLRMQFDAQRRSYESSYGGAEHQIIERAGQPIGRIMVLQEKVLREKDSMLLVDIALFTEHRGLGIGGQLIRELIQQAARDGYPLRLQVLKNNPALRLYERLGFTRTGEDQMYVQMERRPD
jgi:ribosomal protein S18 acetylase RimI-like enzyme